MNEKVVIELKITMPKLFLYTIHSEIQRVLDIIRGTIPKDSVQFTYIVDGNIAKESK